MSNSSNRNRITIFLDDDDDNDNDDNVQVLSLAPPSSPLQWNDFPPSLYVSQPVRIPILDDDDVELRLGPSENRHAASILDLDSTPEIPERSGSSLSLSISNFSDSYYFTTIDLTCTDDNFGTNYRASQKRKRFLHSEPSKESKLTCAICMDTMKEETSTICGHVFCQKCILKAIEKQKKCPTCRKQLVKSQVHRIYLS